MEELSEEVKAALVKQVEFYFSDENLPTDAFMKKKLKAGGAQGTVPHRLPRRCSSCCRESGLHVDEASLLFVFGFVPPRVSCFCVLCFASRNRSEYRDRKTSLPSPPNK